MFASKGGTIVLLDAEGEERAWASGEIMGVARSGITWRECSQPDDCTYWAGSSDQPKRRKLDADAAASLVLAEVLYLSGFGGINGGHILSPSLQTAVSYQLTEDGDLAIHLTDLTTGDSVKVEPTDNFPTFLSDESAVFVPSGNSIVAIDTATGTTQRILTHDGTLYGLLPDPAT